MLRSLRSWLLSCVEFNSSLRISGRKFVVKHRDLQSTKDLVGMRMKKRVGLAFSSPMLTIDSVAERLFNIRECNKPYMNNRCFRLGESMNIPNDKLKKQYEFLEVSNAEEAHLQRLCIVGVLFDSSGSCDDCAFCVQTVRL